MSFLGLDPTAVRQLAAQMNNAANEINQITANLTNMLSNTHWVGPDHDRFESEWNGSHVAQLHQVSQALQEAAQSANNNAAQQEQASNG